MNDVKTILMLDGDGIGPEVMRETRRVIDWFSANGGTRYELTNGLVGGASYDAHGQPLTDDTLKLASEADAVLLGAVGGPQWEDLNFDKKPERGLLGLRKELGLFANLRPAVVFEALAEASTLKTDIVAGLNMIIVRELTGGIYFGEPRGVEKLPDGSRKGVNSLVYTSGEVERIARVAFDLAKKRNGRLCSVDKANVLECTLMWRETVEQVHADYPQVALSHMYVDNAAMQLVRDPKQFDVIVTTNMFGDILSDCAAMLTGSLGMLPSASLGEKGADGRIPGMYEPVHGSAPDIAGKNLANPLAAILSFAMMLRYSFDDTTSADTLEDAVKRLLVSGARTADIMEAGGRQVSTSEMGDAILFELENTAS